MFVKISPQPRPSLKILLQGSYFHQDRNKIFRKFNFLWWFKSQQWLQRSSNEVFYSRDENILVSFEFWQEGFSISITFHMSVEDDVNCFHQDEFSLLILRCRLFGDLGAHILKQLGKLIDHRLLLILLLLHCQTKSTINLLFYDIYRTVQWVPCLS